MSTEIRAIQTTKGWSLHYNVKQYSDFVSVFNDDIFNDNYPLSSYFYVGDASHLCILRWEKNKFTDLYAPSYQTDFLYPNPEFAKLLRDGYKDDGHYLVNYKTGETLLVYDEAKELINLYDWNYFYQAPVAQTNKFLAVLVVDKGFIPIVGYSSTIYPQVLTLLNSMNEFLPPRAGKDITHAGLYAIQRAVLESLDMIPLTEAQSYMYRKFFDFVGSSKLTEKNQRELRKLDADILAEIAKNNEDRKENEKKEKPVIPFIDLPFGVDDVMSVSEIVEEWQNNMLTPAMDKRIRVDLHKEMPFPFLDFTFYFGKFHVHHDPDTTPIPEDDLKDMMDIPKGMTLRYIKVNKEEE